MDFTFADPCEHPDIAAGLGDVVRRYRLCRVACKLVKAVKYRMQLRERVDGAMGSLRKLNGLRRSEQPLDETIELLAANQGDLREALSAFRNLDPDQSKRLAAFLMPGEPIPQPHHEDPQQLVDCIETVELGKLASPKGFDRFERGCGDGRVSDVAKKPRSRGMASGTDSGRAGPELGHR